MNLADKLNMTRPIAVFDVESTGLNPRLDRIIELSAIRIECDGRRRDKCWRINPGIPIPPETTQIHHITDADVADKPTFAGCVDEIDAFFDNCDLAGYNLLHFDIPILEEEFLRAGRDLCAGSRHVLDAQKIFHKKEPRDLSAALKFFCGREHDKPHSAMDDAEATLDVIIGQFEKYADLPKTVAGIEKEFNNLDPTAVDRSARFKWLDGEVVLAFGKKKGEKLSDVAKNDRSFLAWMLKSDFASDTKAIARNALDGKFPVREN